MNKISNLMLVFSLLPSGVFAAESDKPTLLQQSLYTQCIYDICPEHWSRKTDIHSETVSLPSSLKKILENEVDSTFALIKSLHSFFGEHTSPDTEIRDEDERTYLSLRVLNSFRPDDMRMIQGKVVYNQEAFAEEYKNFPQLSSSMNYLANYPIFRQFYQFMTAYRQDGLMFLDTLFNTRDDGLHSLRQIAMGLKNQMKKYEANPNLKILLSRLTDPEFETVLAGDDGNPQNINIFVGQLLILKMTLDLLEDTHYRKLIHGFDIETLLSQKISHKAKDSLHSFLNLSDKDLRHLKLRMLADIENKIELYYRSLPTLQEKIEFVNVSSSAIKEVHSTVRKLFSPDLASTVIAEIDKIQFNSNVVSREELEEKLKGHSDRLRMILGLYEKWQHSKFVYSLLLSRFYGHENLTEFLLKDILDFSDFKVDEDLLEVSAVKGPIIVLGWQAYKSGKTFKGVLYHEMAHKVQYILDRHSTTLKKEDIEKINSFEHCLDALHPEETPKHPGRLLEQSQYSSEDFADAFSALTAQSQKEVSNPSCFFYKEKVEMDVIGSLTNPDPSGSHSSDFFRLLHFEQVRKGKFASTCEEYLRSYHPGRTFNDCLSSFESKRGLGTEDL